MSIGLISEASLDFVKLHQIITDQESNVHVRLTGLVGKTESGVDFNAHIYVLVNDDNRPLSKLFIISAGQSAANDPIVKTFLAQNTSQKVVCQDQVYINGSLANVAVIGNPK